jgi:hypothetical protein
VAAAFEMDPDATRSGLDIAGTERVAAAASRMATPPPIVGRYTASFMTVAAALLAASTAKVGSAGAQGLAATATSVSAVETTESSNAKALGI